MPVSLIKTLNSYYESNYKTVKECLNSRDFDGNLLYALSVGGINLKDKEVDLFKKAILKKGDALVAVDFSWCIFKERWPEAEDLILTSAKASYFYLKHHHKILRNTDFYNKAESIIMTDPEWSFQYARMYGLRWYAAEPAILESPKWACRYACEVIKGRWLEAEDILMTDPKEARDYAIGVLHRRWPEAEMLIMEDAFSILCYAVCIIKGRWIEAEPSLLASGSIKHIREYARDVIKGRWPEAEMRFGEDLIESGGSLESLYRGNYISLLESRWPAAESVILKSPELILYYSQEAIKGRWEEAEHVLAAPGDHIYYTMRYAESVIGGRFYEAEPFILTDIGSAYRYAEIVIKGRWPEAEALIMTNLKWAFEYAKHVIKGRWVEAEPLFKGSKYEKRYLDLATKHIKTDRWSLLETQT
jgi:hypothetical protein